jgi:hypothetical protein
MYEMNFCLEKSGSNFGLTLAAIGASFWQRCVATRISMTIVMQYSLQATTVISVVPGDRP